MQQANNMEQNERDSAVVEFLHAWDRTLNGVALPSLGLVGLARFAGLVREDGSVPSANRLGIAAAYIERELSRIEGTHIDGFVVNRFGDGTMWKLYRCEDEHTIPFDAPDWNPNEYRDKYAIKEAEISDLSKEYWNSVNGEFSAIVEEIGFRNIPDAAVGDYAMLAHMNVRKARGISNEFGDMLMRYGNATDEEQRQVLEPDREEERLIHMTITFSGDRDTVAQVLNLLQPNSVSW